MQQTWRVLPVEQATRIIWYDPERLPQDLNPSVLDRFEEAKAGPRTGAAPSDVN